MLITDDEIKQLRVLILTNRILTDELLAEMNKLCRFSISEDHLRKMHERVHPTPEQLNQRRIREAHDKLCREASTYCMNTFETGTWGFRDMYLKTWHQVGPFSFLNGDDAVLFKLAYPEVANVPA